MATETYNLVEMVQPRVLTYNPSPTPEFNTTVNPAQSFTSDIWPGFGKTVSGTVTENGNPVSRLLRAYDSASGELIVQIMSDPVTGDYEFVGIGSPAVDIVAKDSPNYQAQILNDVVPV